MIDSNNTNHVISQRVLPLKCLRQGYRHLRLRNTQNQPLELSSLFLFSKQQVEFIPSSHAATANCNNGSNSLNNLTSNIGSSVPVTGMNEALKTKHKQFKVAVYGLNAPEEEDHAIQVKVTQDTTVQQVIEQVNNFSSLLLTFLIFIINLI